MKPLGQPWPFTITSPSNHQKLAEVNRLLVLGLIWKKRCLSQKALTEWTGLQASTISNIISEMKGFGLVEDGNAIKAERAGPKETVLEIVPGYSWSMGLALDEQPRILAINGAGHVVAQTDFPRGYKHADIIKEIPGILDNLQRRHHLYAERFAGIGVSVAGVVDSESGMILLSQKLKEVSEPLQTRMEKALGVPVLLERNVACGAYAEHFSGTVQDVESFLYFSINHHQSMPPGFGLGIVIEEEIFHGSNSSAGEVDFLFGRLCLSDGGMAKEAGDGFYRNCGEGLAAVINLLDIDCVVLSDAELTRERMEVLESAMLPRLVTVPGRKISLCSTSLQNNGAALGAALLMLHRKMARDITASFQEGSVRGGPRKRVPAMAPGI